jgi:hypothetical protein
MSTKTRACVRACLHAEKGPRGLIRVVTNILAGIRAEKNDEISRTLRLMHDGIGFDKIIPKQVGYFGKRIN